MGVGLPVLMVVTLAVGISALTLRRSHAASARRAYVGTWTYVSGTAKVGPGFALDAKPAPDGSSERSLEGKSQIVEERDGKLWFSGEDQTNCWFELRFTGDRAEAVPGTTMDCQMRGAEPPATTRVTVVGMSMAMDGEGRAHISGESRFSMDMHGTKRDIDITIDGVAVREPPPKD